MSGKRLKVIFLDCDGVINGYNPIIRSKIILTKLLKKEPREFCLENDVYGVHEAKVYILSKIVKKTGAVVVMSSTWRNSYFDSGDRIPRIEYLRNLMKKYHIKVIDKTGHCKEGVTDNYYMERSYEIDEWLVNHSEDIFSYVVIDDERPYRYEDRWVRTKYQIVGKRQEFQIEGLMPWHIRKAVKILNTEEVYYHDKGRV